MRFEIFVPGPLRNPMNGSHGHWRKHARWARQWRERTHQRLFVQLAGRRGLPPATEPKVVHLHAVTFNAWDDDNLRAGLKPMRDALKDAHVIHDDGPEKGPGGEVLPCRHHFIYTQEVDRLHRGVRITWDLLAATEEKHS